MLFRSKMIYIEQPDVEIKASDNYDKRYFDVTVTTNVAFKMNTVYDVVPEKQLITDGLSADEALKKAKSRYGRFDEADSYVNPRKA